MSDDRTKLYLPAFNGKKFQLWCRWFRAYGNVYKFTEAIDPTGFDALPESADVAISNYVAGKAHATAINKNNTAIETLTMAFQLEYLMDYIDKGCNEVWPE
mmetsp:Transcript_42913/g.62866  ORF Transcript_42913/g.62866 Transcript_42913/m.62866 type:complete len:101 (+) Transcript_42913:339-641(+)